MNTDQPILDCPTCGRPHPAPPGATDPHYCTIGCYRTAQRLDDPDHGDGRRWCPGCSRYLNDTDNRRRWCSAACRVADWRRQQPTPPSPNDTRTAATIGAMNLADVISEHAPAPYTGDDSAAVIDEAIHTLGTLRSLQHVGDAGAVLHLLASLAAHIDTLIPTAIHDARDQEYTWTEIAALTALSRDRVQRLAANHRRTPPPPPLD
jgi:hypothetical protein